MIYCFHHKKLYLNDIVIHTYTVTSEHKYIMLKPESVYLLPVQTQFFFHILLPSLSTEIHCSANASLYLGRTTFQNITQFITNNTPKKDLASHSESKRAIPFISPPPKNPHNMLRYSGSSKHR